MFTTFHVNVHNNGLTQTITRAPTIQQVLLEFLSEKSWPWTVANILHNNTTSTATTNISINMQITLMPPPPPQWITQTRTTTMILINAQHCLARQSFITPRPAMAAAALAQTQPQLLQQRRRTMQSSMIAYWSPCTSSTQWTQFNS